MIIADNLDTWSGFPDYYFQGCGNFVLYYPDSFVPKIIAAMVVNIFLASSSELKDDRKEFQIFISQLNDVWADREIEFNLNIWEDFIDSMSTKGLQQEYN